MLGPGPWLWESLSQQREDWTEASSQQQSPKGPTTQQNSEETGRQMLGE